MICAILLAAGSARRFGGEHKLLATIPYHDATTPLVRVSVERLLAADGIGEVVVVLGRDAERVREAVGHADATLHFICNHHHETGMSSSLRAGVRAAQRHGDRLEGAFVALADQPELRSDVVSALVVAFARLPRDSRHDTIVVPRYDGVMGHPVLFGARVLPELLDVTGDRGGRAVIERDSERVHHVDFAFSAPEDIDTTHDLHSLLGRARRRDEAR